MKKLPFVLAILLSLKSFTQINCPSFGGFNTIIFNGCTPLPYNYSTVVGTPTVTPLVTALSNFTGCTASIENNQFFAFQATAATMSFTINPGTVTGGLQAWIFSTADCNTPTVLACNSSGFTSPITLTSSSFVPGQIYYIMIDGFAGATGNYSFANITPAPGSGGQLGSTFPLSFAVDSASCGLSDGAVTITASNATPPYSYSLGGSSFQSSNVFSNLPAGSYSVVVRDNNNCTSSANVTVPAREIRIIGDSVYCASAGPLTLKVVGGTQFTWTPTSGIVSSNANGSEIQVAPAQTTDYVVVSNVPPQQCKFSDTIRVRVAGSFTNNLTASKTTICLNESSTLSVSPAPSSEGPFSYSWTPTTGLASPGANSTIARPTTSTKYFVLVTSKDGCKMRDSVQIDVQGFGPKVRVTPTANYVCPGSTVRLNSEIIPIQTGPSQDPANACPNCTFPFPPPQVGTGTASSATAPTPFRSFWEDGRTQYLFRASELTNAGIGPGVITDIQFFVTTKNSGTTPFNNFTVKMGGTNLNQLPANTFVTQNMFVVHTSNYVTTPNSWNNIPLDIPFNWDGQTNLIIEVCFDNGTGQWTGWDYVQYSTAFTGATHYSDRDGASGCTLAWENSSQLRPNIRFVYGELPTGNLSLLWTPSIGLSSDTAAHPFATINSNIAYTLTVNDGICSGDTTIQMFVDTAVAIKAIDDFIVCNNSPALLTATVLNKVQPVCTPNYSVAPVNFNFETSANKTPVPFSTVSTSNNRNATINLPFPFKFYCTDYNSLLVNENGFVTFATNFTGTGAVPAPFPNTGTPNNTIAGLWLDLNANANSSGSGTISYFVTGNYPYRTLVIEWNNVLVQGQGNTVSFQIKLFESTNWIETHIQAFSNISGNKVIGVENAAGTAATTPANRNGTNFNLTTSEAWRFIPDVQGTGFVAFQWSPTTNLSSEFGDTVIATPTAKTKYVVAALFSNGCITRDTVEVDTKTFAYSLSASKDSLCPGESSTLTFSGNAANLQWQPANSLSNPTAAVTTATPASSTTYIVQATDADGCRVVDSLKVFVKINGAVTLGKDTGVCFGQSVVLTPIGGPFASYSWRPNGENTPTITVTKSGDYFVILSDGTCSFNSDTVTITVYEPYQLKAFKDTTICSGQSANLTSEPGYTNYIWNTGAQTNNITVNTAGLYSYSAVDNNGCRQFSDTVQVRVTNPPVITFTATPSRICPGEESILDAGTLPGIIYSWTKPNDNNVYTGNTISAAVPGTYSVTASDNGCTTSSNIEVLGAAKPNASIGDDVAVCSCDTTITLNSGSVDPNDSFLWSTGSQNSSIAVTTSGNYAVRVTSQYGCVSVDTVRVDIRCLKVLARADKYELIKGQSTNISADSVSYAGVFEYNWTPGTFLTETNVMSTTAKPDSSIVYLLRVKDVENNCEAFDTVRISIVLPGTFVFPSVFTPNGDGKNDLFGPYLPEGSSAQFPYLRIYNRWGQLVYECLNCDFTQPNVGWDGTFDGNAQPGGTYQMIAEVKIPNIDDPKKLDTKFVHKSFTLLK